MNAPHFFTLTGNLLAERTLGYERWSAGKTQRARCESFQVGGKGINVSKMLSRLGVPNTALCFVGGAPGAECEAWLKQHQFQYHAFPTEAVTRSGTVVRDASGTHAETTFLGPDAAPDAAAVLRCADFLNHQSPGHCLVLSGSFPGWASADFAPLRAAIESWAQKGVLVVDTYGPALQDLAQHRLALLKINADELASLNRSRIDDLPAQLEQIIVTDGPRAVHVRDRDGRTAQFTPPAVREISPTGSGDVLLACVLAAHYVRKLPLLEAVTFAIPYAALNAAHPGIADFPLPGSDS